MAGLRRASGKQRCFNPARSGQFVSKPARSAICKTADNHKGCLQYQLKQASK